MKTMNDLLGPMRALAHIRPPEPSYADWRRFLTQCQKAGVAAVEVTKDGRFRRFATPVGFALLRRWRWLEDAEKRGIPYEQAEAEFCASFERDEAAILAATKQHNQTLKKVTAEVKADKPDDEPDPATEIFDYAKRWDL